ncbi:hypothetical protein DFJ73DRAFT_871508, partial [Zopfochytrium polystomum]
APASSARPLPLPVAAMLAVLAPLSVRADPITFVGSPYATSSLGGDTTILYAPAAGSTIDLPSGAQFPYTKNASLPDHSRAGDGDARERLAGRRGASGNYYLRMAGDGGAYNVKSGLFGIALAGQGAVTVGGPGIVGTASGAGSTPAKSGSVPSASFSLLLVVSVVSVVLSMMTM